MCFVFIWEQTANCATYSINWLVFKTEMKTVYCAVRTGSLSKAICASYLKGECFLQNCGVLRMDPSFFMQPFWRLLFRYGSESWKICVPVSLTEPNYVFLDKWNCCLPGRGAVYFHKYPLSGGACCLLFDIIYPEYGGTSFLQKFGTWLPHYTALTPFIITGKALGLILCRVTR